MKKVLLLGTILAATVAHGAVLANAPAPVAPGCPKAFQGFHLGGNIGYGLGFGKQKFARASENANGVTAIDHRVTNDLSVKGVDGGVGVGYTHRIPNSNWALGIGFDANWVSSKGKFTDSRTPRGEAGESVSLQARLRHNFQLYGKLGYVLRDIAMPFVALGWENSHWKHSATLNVAKLEDEEGVEAAFSKTTHKSKRINSLMWKAGVDFLATKHVVVGFEYTGSMGGKQKSILAYENPQTEGKEAIGANFKPQYNKFALTAKIVY